MITVPAAALPSLLATKYTYKDGLALRDDGVIVIYNAKLAEREARGIRFHNRHPWSTDVADAIDAAVALVRAPASAPSAPTMEAAETRRAAAVKAGDDRAVQAAYNDWTRAAANSARFAEWNHDED